MQYSGDSIEVKSFLSNEQQKQCVPQIFLPDINLHMITELYNNDCFEENTTQRRAFKTTGHLKWQIGSGYAEPYI